MALHLTEQWNKSTYFLTSCQPLILANHFWQAKWRKMLPQCFKVHSSDDQWGRASCHDHWWFVFSPLWQMSFYPCVTTSDLKSTLGSSLRKSSVLWPSLQGLCPACGSQPVAIGSRDWGKPPVAGEVFLSPFCRLRRPQTCPSPHCEVAFGTWVTPRLLCFSTECLRTTLASSPDWRAPWCLWTF